LGDKYLKTLLRNLQASKLPSKSDATTNPATTHGQLFVRLIVFVVAGFAHIYVGFELPLDGYMADYIWRC